MNRLATVPFLIILVLFCAIEESSAQSTRLSRAEMQADLDFLKQTLEALHPNLYTYASETEVSTWFSAYKAALEEQIEPQEAYRLVTSFSDVLKDGHSYIYPSAAHLDQFYNGAPLFPLDVFLLDEHLVVTHNFSAEQNIPTGATLIKINGKTIAEMLTEMLRCMPRDGNNPEYSKHLLYQFFPAYYSFFYGFPEEFQIAFIDAQGASGEVLIKGVKRDDIRKRRTAQTAQKETGIQLEIDKQHQMAVLTIPSFDNKILKEEYDTRFKKEIRQAFRSLAENNIQHLAIDLRDNQGGELSNGVYLLQYVMPHAFKCVSSYYVIKQKKDTNRQVKRINNKWDNYFKPRKKDHFAGEVYLFINGGSYSCSAIVANTFKENKRGQIIGQMSGGSAFINSGGPNKVITLPNSKITFTIPRTQYNLRANPAVIGAGVIPDVAIPDSPARLSGGPDPYTEQLKQFITN